MKHSVKHDIGLELAKKATEAAFDSYKARFGKYNPTASWSGDHADIGFSVKGFNLGGAIDVKESSIDMDLDVPFMLRAFKGKALDVIEKEIRKWVDKAKAGEL